MSKYVVKVLLLNLLWVAWICLSVFLGYIIYREAFPSSPALIIPFSLLFLLSGGAVAFTVYKLKKKKSAATSADSVAVRGGETSSAESKPATVVEPAGTKSMNTSSEGKDNLNADDADSEEYEDNFPGSWHKNDRR